MMQAARKLPIGIQDFETIRNENYIYVDKTQYIWDLVQSGKSYFLSRPRRFGKSLFVSALKSYFEGRKDLFKGLAIEALENRKGEKAWIQYPILYFSLSGGNYLNEPGLEDVLSSIIHTYEKEYQLTGNYAITGKTLPVQFRELIENLYAKTGKKIVVLVDEYDKPLLETMAVNRELEEKNRQIYKSFFSVLKDEDALIKFTFFTGVTRFGKVSIFSDLNQLNDISLDDAAAGICGINESQLFSEFKPEVETLMKIQNLSYHECLKKLSQTYDGYHFSPHGEGMYNPFSLFQAFSKNSFGKYWFETGTPSFLIHELKASGVTAVQLTDGIETNASSLQNYQDESLNLIALLYQTGYLTIYDYDQEFDIYTLRFPNDEVKDSIFRAFREIG